MQQYCCIICFSMQQNSSIKSKAQEWVTDMYFPRLEDLRVDADKTQAQIAELLHCKREVYRRYEKGIYEIPVWALIRLAAYYRVSTDYILGLSDRK